MTDATKVILQQWGSFGAVLIVLGIVIWKLWTDSTNVFKATITTLTADNKALTTALAECNAARQADYKTMTTTLVELVKDNAAGLANATNAMEASTEEMRYRRGG